MAPFHPSGMLPTLVMASWVTHTLLQRFVEILLATYLLQKLVDLLLLVVANIKGIFDCYKKDLYPSPLDEICQQNITTQLRISFFVLGF